MAEATLQVRLEADLTGFARSLRIAADRIDPETADARVADAEFLGRLETGYLTEDLVERCHRIAGRLLDEADS